MPKVGELALQSYDVICDDIAALREKNPGVLEAYSALMDQLEEAAAAIKKEVVKDFIHFPEWRNGKLISKYAVVKAVVRQQREANLEALEALLPAGLVEDIIERKVSLAKLDDAVKRGEVDIKKVKSAITVKESVSLSVQPRA